MPESEYSSELCCYIGQTELAAFQMPDGFKRYTCFCEALRLLLDDLSPEEKGLARRLLEARARETRPSNIGGASGDASDGD